MKKITTKVSRRISAHKGKLYRLHPLAWIFWIGVVAIIAGLAFFPFKFLILPGLIIVTIYIAYFLVWLSEKL